MSSKIEILVPAADPALLSLDELRALAPSLTDDQLTALGLESSEWVASLCGVRTANGYPPTFKAETLRETFLGYPSIWGADLVLGRKFLSGVTVLENGMALVEGADFVVQDVQGIIERVSSGWPVACWGVPVVVEYTAGFGYGSPPTPVPALLKAATTDYVRLRFNESVSDPLVRSETTVDLDSVTYGASDASLSALESATMSRLARFMTGVPG